MKTQSVNTGHVKTASPLTVKDHYINGSPGNAVSTSTNLTLPNPCHIGLQLRRTLDCLGHTLRVIVKQVVGPVKISTIYFNIAMRN